LFAKSDLDRLTSSDLDLDLDLGYNYDTISTRLKFDCDATTDVTSRPGCCIAA